MVMEGLCSSELWSYSHAYYHTAFLIMTENSFLIKNRFLINIYFFFYINHCIHDIITGKKRFVTLMLLKAQISSHYVLLKVVFMKEAPDFFFFFTIFCPNIMTSFILQPSLPPKIKEIPTIQSLGS